MNKVILSLYIFCVLVFILKINNLINKINNYINKNYLIIKFKIITLITFFFGSFFFNHYLTINND